MIFEYVYHVYDGVVPERPNITNVYPWLDEELVDPQPVIYVEWTVCNVIYFYLFFITAIIVCEHGQSHEIC